MKRYFYITIHFSPEYEGTVLARLKDDLYINTETGETYRKRALYDFGWGQESGFELMPPLSFKELIKLVEQPGALPQKKRSAAAQVRSLCRPTSGAATYTARPR